MHARSVFGRSGEDAAIALLRRSGLRILERNYRCRHGEIDIVAREGSVLVFCEVKTRATDRWGDPSEAVNAPKRMRLRRLAVHWLQERGEHGRVRFDVVSVIVRNGRSEIRHIRDAF